MTDEEAAGYAARKYDAAYHRAMHGDQADLNLIRRVISEWRNLPEDSWAKGYSNEILKDLFRLIRLPESCSAKV